MTNKELLNTWFLSTPFFREEKLKFIGFETLHNSLSNLRYIDAVCPKRDASRKGVAFFILSGFCFTMLMVYVC
jgi:hypothetical protein